MRITCPTCDVAYEVPEALLGGATRRLRCVRCGNEWIPDIPAAAVLDVVPPLIAAPPPEPPEERRLEPPPRRDPARVLPMPRVEGEPPPFIRERPPQSVLGSAAIVVASLVVLGALGWAAYAWRGEVMQAWPPSQRLFAMLGLG